MTAVLLPGSESEPAVDRTVVGENLSIPLFRTLSGVLAGHPYLKIVVDRAADTWHLLDTAAHPFHVNYVATRVLGMSLDELDARLDAFNASVYTDPERRFLLGVLSLHTDENSEGRTRTFLVLETTEADTMNGELLTYFHAFVQARVDARLPLLLKPANHGQEEELSAVCETEVPRVLGHELFGNRARTPLNPGDATGRLRWFSDRAAYEAATTKLGWADIVAMPCLPDDVPRVAGFVNTEPITPLSHTNVLASGWGIPNAIVRDLPALVAEQELDGSWIRYRVREDSVSFEKLTDEPEVEAPTWHQQRIRLTPPMLEDAPALELHRLRLADRDRYGTKAAHLGELHHVLDSRSADLTAFHSRPRPPRTGLRPYLAARLGLAEPGHDELRAAASEFVASTVSAPVGVALPFALQHRFLTSSPALQQGIGKLKMALELGATEVLDSLCLQVQQLIRHTPMPDEVTRQITSALPGPLAAGTRLVVRSSSNAEDLPGFSAAGVYDSVTTVHGQDELLDAVRQVWASLVSPRSVRLRHEVGISLDDTYMGVIVQEYVPAGLGGVLVTCNPTRREDFRNVYLNCSPGSPEQVVDGTVLPQQYLYNTVEGGGRTVALGSLGESLPARSRARLADLALTGRLLQSHFSVATGRGAGSDRGHDSDRGQDSDRGHWSGAGAGDGIGEGDVDDPLDIEWLMTEDGGFRLVQIRPYAL